MKVFRFVTSIILALLSCVVLAYTSMATMIGPWIAPTIVLIAGLGLKLREKLLAKTESDRGKITELALIQTVGSVGGIVATAVGFTLPTLFFLDRARFEALLSHPTMFCLVVGAICLAAGSVGIVLGRAFKKTLLSKESLSFPVSSLIYKTITSQTKKGETKKLLSGLSIGGTLCALRDFFSIKKIYLFSSIFKNNVPIMIMPILWSIGFIAGTSIALPLFVGMLSKYVILYPLSIHSEYLPFKLFEITDYKQLTMGFCGGLLLAQILPGMLKYPSLLWRAIKEYTPSIPNRWDGLKKMKLESLFALGSTILLLSFFKFPPLAQLLMIVLTVVAAYHISYIGAQIGLVQIGRFTTFVMLPTMIFFKLNTIQITVLSVFVSSCITVTADLLFGYKIGELCSISPERIRRYQWIGTIITAVSLGFFLWLLFTNLQLGTPELFAQRGKTRALLVQSFSFNWSVMFLGFLYGLFLKKIRVNPAMVFGGLFMPNGLTLGLLFGSLATLIFKQPKKMFPLFSGIFVGESLWMLISIVAKIV